MIVGMHSLIHAAEEVGLIAGILIGLAVIIKAVNGAWTFLRKMVELVDGLEEMYDQRKLLHSLVKELTPNEGTSVKDTVNRIDRNVAANARNIQVVYGTVLKMHDLDPIDAALLESLEHPDAD